MPPLYRGQGNQRFRDSTPVKAAHRGQEVPYNVNGAPSGGNADTLDGQDSLYFLARANHTGTQTSATISDFNAAVTALVNSIYTAANVLTKLLTVDGAGSGLDADLLDAQQGTYYLDRANHTGTQAQATITGLVAALAAKLDTASYTAADVLAKILTVDGSGSGLDADLLRGTTPTAFGLSLIDDANSTAARATIGVVIGTDVQAFHANLTAFAGLTLIADRLPYANGAGTLALATFTAAGRALVDDADAAAQRGTLGLGTAATQNTGTSGGTIPLLNANNTHSGDFTVTGAFEVDGASPTIRIVATAGFASQFRFIHADASERGVVRFDASKTFEIEVAGTSRFTITSAGVGALVGSLDVQGDLRCDTFRIDQAATAATPTPTHTFTVNLNGTAYRVPCVI